MDSGAHSLVACLRHVAIITALSLGPAAVARAHPLHTTLTEIRMVPGARGQVAELRVRAFVDDFSRAVAMFAGRSAPRDSSVVPAEAARYLGAHIRVTDARGKALQLQWCGMRTERGVVWACIRTVAPVALHALVLRQTTHMELFTDQVNLVQVFDGSRRVSHLFVRGGSPKKLT